MLTFLFLSSGEASAYLIITGTVKVSASMASVLWPSLSAHSDGETPVRIL